MTFELQVQCGVIDLKSVGLFKKQGVWAKFPKLPTDPEFLS